MTIRSLLRRALVGVAALLLVASGTTEARLPHGTPIVVIPPAALAAGYVYRTYGPSVNIGGTCVAGKNCWYLFNFLGVTPIAGQAVQNGDGSVSLGADGSGFGANVSTAHLVGGVLKGTTFKTGYYIEFVVKFTPTLGSSALPFPALWSLDSGFLANSYQWPGQAVGFHHRIENDFMQWPHNSTAFWVGDGLIDWYGYNTGGADLSGVSITGTGGQISFSSRSVATHVGDFVTLYGTSGGPGSISGYTSGTAYQVLATNGSTTATLGTVAGGAIVTSCGGTCPGAMSGLNFAFGNVTQPNAAVGPEISIGGNSFATYQRYGFLIKPATSISQGGILNYLNDIQVNFAAGGANPVWDLYSAANPPPPVAGSSAGSLIDTLQMMLIMNTDATCPMTIESVSVWQKDASGAITTSLMAPAANDDFYELALVA